MAQINKEFTNCNLFCYEDSIKQCFIQIANFKNGQQITNYSNQIINLFKTILKNKASFKYPFDSLKQVSKIHSPDSVVRIYSWVLLHNNAYKHFGFIQYVLPHENNITIYQLYDKSEEIDNPEQKILSNLNWLGALYYKILQNKSNNKIIYTLLGFNANNLLSNKKIIDVLTFDDHDKPVFGNPVFKRGNEIVNRVVFEYSSKAVMMLKYDERVDMIVCDHLSPEQPLYHGQYMFYGPDFSYDGWKYTKGMWELVPDIDIRNIKK